MATAPAYSPDQIHFAQAIREAMNFVVAQRVSNAINDQQHHEQSDAVMRVLLRYAMFIPEMLRPGFLTLCGCPDMALMNIMGMITDGEEKLAEHGTLDAVALLIRAAPSPRSAMDGHNTTLQ
jgi:hypothetical protein